jgi:LuxR family maltose regulon positive regulatory protein
MSSLLKTKLRCPPKPVKRVPRPHLLGRLDAGLASGRGITLVSAPAGFGKTTCLSEWVSALDLPAAWLSLDPADDDPGRFFSYLIAALQTVNRDLGREIEGILRAGQLPPAEIVSAALINDILELEERFLLVLDDFQLIQDPIILQVMGELVDNLPPSLHLVLLTREDPSLPMARLRANNQLAEIRAGDLRFSSSEVDCFLNEVMGLSLSRGDIGVLEERTEGWIVGLQLAALAMQSPRTAPGRPGPSDFIAGLSGSHRFILNYLTEEVLSLQPEDVQQFLLQTSILEALNGDLCNAVTGRADGHLMLERLFAANLFLVPLDDEGNWYRYHHLFADLLRGRQNRLHKGETALLHQRASRWYAQASLDEGGGFISEAIRHALAGGDYEAAVHLIESHAMDMLMQWHVKTVEGWMRAIPAEWCAHSIRANLAFAWLYFMRGTPARAFPYLERLQILFSTGDSELAVREPVSDSLKAKWLALQSMLLNAQGKPAEGLALGTQALELAPEEDIHVRSLIYLGLAGSYQELDDYEHAVQAFQMIIRHGLEGRSSVAEMLGVSGLGLLLIQHGQLHLAFDIVSKGVERMEGLRTLPPISTALYGELGTIHYQWGQIEPAHRYFQRAIQVGTLSGYSDAELFYGVILSRLFQISGDLEASAREIRKAADLMQVEAPAAVREEVISQQVRVDLALDRLPQAEALLEPYGFTFKDGFSYPDIAPGHLVPLSSRENINRPVGLLYISALRVLLYRASTRGELSNLESGVELADILASGALQRQYIPFALETLLLRSRIHTALGNEEARLAGIARALQLAQPEGYITIFVEEGAAIADALRGLLAGPLPAGVHPDFARGVLAAFSKSYLPGFAMEEQRLSQPTAGSSPVESGDHLSLVEGLSERELDVLRLMAEGLKYREIAEELYISMNTVRSHVKSMYGKLNVNNRTKAIELARQLGIL